MSVLKLWCDRWLPLLLPESAGSLSSLPSHSSEPEEDMERRMRADQQAATRHRENARLWYQRRLVVILCEMALVEQLQLDGRSSRQVSGRLSWFTRQCQGQSVEDVLSLARPQLVLARAEELVRDARLLQRLFEEPVPENDYQWIYSSQVGNATDPERYRMEQRAQLLLLQSLPQRMCVRDTATFVQRAVATTGGNLYRDFILLMWPLFNDTDRLAFQTWYQGYTTAETAPGCSRPEPSSASGLRREA